VAPLRAADDAQVIMTDDLGLPDVVDLIVQQVRR
jgi:cytidylate kinase